jgi:hypothetical protein
MSAGRTTRCTGSWRASRVCIGRNGVSASSVCGAADDLVALAALAAPLVAAASTLAWLVALAPVEPSKARGPLADDLAQRLPLPCCSAAAADTKANCRGLPWGLAGCWRCWPCSGRVGSASNRPARNPPTHWWCCSELTPEMLAADSPPSRLEQARRKLLDLLQARSDSQTAIIVYAGSAHTLVPLSDDLGDQQEPAGRHQAIDHAREPGSGPIWRCSRRSNLLKQGDLGLGTLCYGSAHP